MTSNIKTILFIEFKNELEDKGKPFIKSLIQIGLRNENSKETYIHSHVDSKIYEFQISKRDNSIVFVAQYISEKIEFEKAKKAKDQAEQRAQFIHQFLANMSHEIRTPLNGIIGMLDAMEDMHLTTQQAGTLKFAKVSSESLLNIINDVLDLSKIQSGKLELKPVDLNILETVRESKRLFLPIAKQNQNKIQIDLASDLPLEMRFDKIRFFQILNNLVSNANKFTSEGTITIDVSSNNDLLKVQVKDQGVGIKAEQ